MTVNLIPRRVFFGNPDRAMVRLSPDGRWLSYLAPLDNVLNVWVAPLDDLSAARPITHDKVRSIRSYTWAYTSQHILHLQDRNGDENWRVYCTDVSSGDVRDLTPFENVHAIPQEFSATYPEDVLIQINDRDPALHDLYRINILTGARTRIMENTGFAGYLTDAQFNVRFGVRPLPDGGLEVLRYSHDGEWSSFEHIPSEDNITTEYIGFDESGNTLYATYSVGRDTAALVAIDPDSGAQRILAEDPRADLSQPLLHPTNRRVQAIASIYERKTWQVVDDSIMDDIDYLRTVATGDMHIDSRTLDDKLWLVAYVMDAGPVRYYLYDRDQRASHFLFTNNTDLEGLTLAPMHPVVIPARDGLNLVSYYTLPVASDPGATGRPDYALPMVLLVHGGPWGRDSWGYNPIHQWLANRGYAVLSVNFRSSTGFGKAFTNAGNKEWGAKMHDDLLDAVDWAVAQGIADRDRVAIMGGSYGGYATLAGLTFTPETFACGVDIVGPSNLVTLLETVPPYWKPLLDMMTTRIGDHRTEEGREFLTSRSPLTYAERIQRPLLIGQGANDPRVKQAESDQIVQAMQAQNIPVTYVLYPDEGHGFAREENNLSFFAVAEAFLAGVLEEAYQPIGDDFAGSSIQVITGADAVPGLSETLASE